MYRVCFSILLTSLFFSSKILAIPDDGNRGSGTTITTVSTPSGTQSVVTDYNTNDGSTVTTSRDSSGNVTTTRSSGTDTGSNTGNTTSSNDDDDDDSSTSNTGGGSTVGGGTSGNGGNSVYRSIVGALSPVSTIFSAATQILPSSRGVVNLVVNAVNRTAVGLQNRFVQELQPDINALTSGMRRMGQDMGGRPIPPPGSPVRQGWESSSMAAFYRGIDASYRNQGLNPRTQMIPNGPMLAAVNRGLSSDLKNYDPRNMTPNKATLPSAEEFRVHDEMRMYKEIDDGFRAGIVQISYPGEQRLLNLAELDPHQRFGHLNSMIVQVNSPQVMGNLNSIVYGDRNFAGGFQDERGRNLGFAGGVVVVSTQNDGTGNLTNNYLDLVRHELNHAADTAIEEIAWNRSQDPNLSEREREEYRYVQEAASNARYGCLTCPETQIDDFQTDQMSPVARDILNNHRNGYYGLYTEFRAFTRQNPTRNEWVDWVVESTAQESDPSRRLSRAEAEAIHAAIAGSNMAQFTDAVLNDFVEEELERGGFND